MRTRRSSSTRSAWSASAAVQRPLRPLLFSGPRSAPSLRARIAGKRNANWVGRPLPFFQFTVSRLCRETARLSPRPCLYSTKRCAGRFRFASQFFVGQALSGGLGERALEAFAIAGLAIVVTESLFVQITEEMEGFDADIRSLQAALQERPEILDSVRMNLLVYVCLCMVDHVMDILAIQTVVGNLRIGEDFRSSFDVLANLGMERFVLHVRDVRDANLAGIAIQNAHNDSLTAAAGSADRFRPTVLVHVAGEATDEGFVGFDLAFQFRPERTFLHCQTDALEHEPRGFLSNAQILRQLVRADAILAVGQQPDGRKPLFETDRGVFEDSADLNRELAALVLTAAFPAALICQEVHLVATAQWAFNDAVRPTQAGHKLKTYVWVLEIAYRVQQRAGQMCFHASNLASGTRLVKYVIAQNKSGGGQEVGQSQTSSR